jgi:ABC-type multidrug transport system ATPase subunit
VVLGDSPIVLTVRGLRAGPVGPVDFTLQAGEILGVVGAPGAGKSTLIEALAGEAAVDDGTVRWFDVGSVCPADRVGVLTKNSVPLSDRSGYQEAYAVGEAAGINPETLRARLHGLFDWMGLRAQAHRPVARYDETDRRKLGLIKALVPHPRVLLLDEPGLHLGHFEQPALIQRLELLRLTGTAVLLATPDPLLAERLCQRVMFLHQGHVVRTGYVAALLTEVAGAKEIELVVRAPVDLAKIRAVDGVEAAHVHGDHLKVLLARGRNPAAILAVLNGSFDFVEQLTVRRPNLGDLYAKLTGTPLVHV